MQTPPVTGEINNYLVVSTGLGSIKLVAMRHRQMGNNCKHPPVKGEINNYLV